MFVTNDIKYISCFPCIVRECLEALLYCCHLEKTVLFKNFSVTCASNMAETVNDNPYLTDCPQSEVLDGPNCEHFTWKITDKKLITEIWNAKWQQSFNSEPFTMANLTWTLRIYPNGMVTDDFGGKKTGEVIAYLQLFNSKRFISKYQISLIISDQHSFVLASKKEASFKIFGGSQNSPLSVWKSISMGTPLTITVSLNTPSILLSEEGEHLINELQSISAPLNPVPKNVCFRWQVDPQVFSVFKNIGTDHQGCWRGASPIFGNMWQILWNAIGQEDGDHNVFAELVCINPPPFASTIQVTVKCEISEFNDSQRNNIEFHTQFGQYCSIFNDQIYCGKCNLSDIEKITFIVNIESINVTYYDPKELHPRLICDTAQIAHVLSLNEADKSAPCKMSVAVSDDHKSAESVSVPESVDVDNKQKMDAVAAEISVLQSTVKEQNETLEENKNVINDMMKRMEAMEKELETQYKPRIKSLWNGLHGMDKVTKSMQNEIKQIALQRNVMDNQQKDNGVSSITERMNQLEMNMSRFMSNSQRNDDPKKRTLEAVRKWMDKVVQLPEYLDLFVENGFDHLSVIQTLTIDDLLEMGIEKKGHRIRIVQAIAKLKASELGIQKRSTVEGASWI